MKTIQVDTYNFNELSDKAKETARNWWREVSAGDNFFAEAPTEDLKAIGKLLGLDISNVYWSGFSSQGDGACFEASWQASAVQTDKVKEYAPQDSGLARIAGTFESLAKQFPEASFSVKQSGHYYHKHCTSFEVDLGLDTDKAPESELTNGEEALTEVARDLMQWFYRQLEKEYNYTQSDECVDESIRANDYDFTIDGNRSVTL